MDSYIFIDGLVMWLSVGFFIFLFFFVVYVGCVNVKLTRENEKLMRECDLKTDKLNRLYSKLSDLKDKYYKEGFKKQLEENGDV